MPSLATAPEPPRPQSLLMTQAREVSRRLRDLFAERRCNLAAIADQLAQLKKRELWRYLGYPSLAAYAWQEHSMGKSKLCELTGIVQRCESLPEIGRAFRAGELEWTKAREITLVATPETEAEWLAKGQARTAEELRAERRGEPEWKTRVLRMTPEQAAYLDQFLAGARAERPGLSDAELLIELVLSGASGQGGEAPTQRVVIYQCGTCEVATSETREGPVLVAPAAVAQARCGGEVHDLRQTPSKVSRAIPRAVRRRVFDRDRRRCRVPGCRNMAGLDAHHRHGWRRGHDPDGLLTLCWAHHRAVHEGLLRIEGDPKDPRFLLLDGTVLGAGEEPFSCENNEP